MPPAHLGIDFGTSHTVAVLRRADGRVEALVFDDGSPLLRSGVYAERDGRLVAGVDAVHSARLDPARYEPNPKRRVDDGSVLLGERESSTVELFAAVLGRVRERCTEVNGSVPPHVTLTHPAAWGPTRKRVLRTAAAKAGFANVRLLPEPVAAATYYAEAIGRTVPVGAAVVVHDFGGGTFDASVVRRTGDGFEVLAVDGLDDLGGVDIDEAIVAHLRATYPDPEAWQRLLAPDTNADRRALRLFREDVRLAKERLSRHTSAELHIPVLDKDAHVTREELEALTAPLLARAVNMTQAVVEEAALPAERVAGVFLVGGGSRMPLVATLLHRELGHAPTIVDNIEQVVAHGAILEGPEAPNGAEAARTAAAARPVAAPPDAAPDAERAEPAAEPPAPDREEPTVAPDSPASPRTPETDAPDTVDVRPEQPEPTKMPLTAVLMATVIAIQAVAEFVPAYDTSFPYLVLPSLVMLLGSAIALVARYPGSRHVLVASQILYIGLHLADAVYRTGGGYERTPADTLPYAIALAVAGYAVIELALGRPSDGWFRPHRALSKRNGVMVRAAVAAVAALAILAGNTAEAILYGSSGPQIGYDRADLGRPSVTYPVGQRIRDFGFADGGFTVVADEAGLVTSWRSDTGEALGSTQIPGGGVTSLAVARLDDLDIVVLNAGGRGVVLRVINGGITFEPACTFGDPGSYEVIEVGVLDGTPMAVTARGAARAYYNLDDCGERLTYEGDRAEPVLGILVTEADSEAVAVAYTARGVEQPRTLRDGSPVGPKPTNIGITETTAVTRSYTRSDSGSVVTLSRNRLARWELESGERAEAVDVDAAVPNPIMSYSISDDVVVVYRADATTLRVCNLANGKTLDEFRVATAEGEPVLMRPYVSYGGTTYLAAAYGNALHLFYLPSLPD